MRAKSLAALAALILLCGGCRGPSGSAGIAQPLTAGGPDAAAPMTDFPKSWVGTWRGASANITPEGRHVDFGMELTIEPIAGSDRFTWKIVYIDPEGTRQVRPYELVTVDASKGHYQVDERSSIVIDSYLVDNVFCSVFAVQSTVIAASYRVSGDRMLVQLISVNGTNPIGSGGENGVPRVNSHVVTGVQRATLLR